MILTAAAAFALAAGVQAGNNEKTPFPLAVRAYTFDVRATEDYDATFQLWTKEAKQAGYGYAYQVNVHPFDSDNPLGVWGSKAHTVAAIARNMGAGTADGIANTLLNEGNWYRSEILYFEQLTLISACLANINDILKPEFRDFQAAGF